MKTQTVERIRIRDRSGLIKGPFRRDEVLELIRDRKIDGEEEIFLESEGRWKPIGADTQFFDLIQEVLFGIKSGTQTGNGPDGAWDGSVDPDRYANLEATERASTEHKSSLTGPTKFQGLTKTVPLAPKEKATLTARIAPIPPEPNIISEVSPAAAEPSPPAGGFADLAAPAREKKRFRGAPLILFVVLLVMGLMYLVPETNAPIDLSTIRLDFNFKQGYFRPLQLRLRLLGPLKAPARELTSDVRSIQVLPLNVHDLMLKLDEIEKLPGSEVNVSTWIYKSWTYRILGDVIAAANPGHGAEFRNASDQILAHLQSIRALDAEFTTLFAALDFLLAGDIGKSVTELSKLKEASLPGRIFRREVTYWATVGGAGSAVPSAAIDYDDLGELNLKYRFEEDLRKQAPPDSFQPDFLNVAEDLLSEDSHSLLAWFLLSKYYSQKLQGNVAIPNRYYFTGLCQLSLWPRTLQAMYWRTYGQFLKNAGEKQADRLTNAADLIEAGTYETAGGALDIDDPFFRFRDLLKTYSKAFEQNEMNPIELASFEILSEASTDAKGNLVSVLIAPLLDRNWSLAERRLRLLEKTFPFEPDVQVLRVWYEGEKFRFENAQEILSESFGTAGGDGKDILKAEGILLVLGRDYDRGIATLKKHLESHPDDAITLYFLGRAHLEEEKYIECVRFSQLSQMNSVGPLKLRSQTMNFRCRVLAQLGVDQALREFSQFISRFPRTSATREEYVRALLDADRSQEALKVAEQDVIDNPQSGSLKILLGEVYEKRGAHNEALALYNEARKVDPKFAARAPYKIADLFFKERRYAEAADHYYQAAQRDRELPELFLKAARAHRRAGQTDDAQQMYFLEIEQRPAVLDTFIEASEFLLESGRPAMVPDLFQRFSENFRNDPRVLTRLAQSYFAVGDAANARLNAELAIRQAPTESEPYRILGNIFEAQGQHPLAKANYEKYLTLVPQAPEAASLRQKLSNPPFTAP